MSFMNKTSRIQSLVKAAENLQTTNRTENFWKPTRDKADNAYAVIRFLPEPPDENMPWVQYWEHFFEGPTGKWYAEKSLTTIGQKDPVGEYNAKLWNSVSDENAPERVQARQQKRNLHYVSNIYVISDPGNPSNEGKVMLYKYGKQIHEKLMDLMHPSFEGETPVDPFDLLNGADFKVRVRRGPNKWITYDKSEFSSPSPLLGGDERVLEEVYSQVKSLQEFIDPDTFKSYEELERRLHFVLNLSPSDSFSGTSVAASRAAMQDEPVAAQPTQRTTAAPAVTEIQATSTGPSFAVDDDDDDDTMSYFRRLAQDS